MKNKKGKKTKKGELGMRRKYKRTGKVSFKK
jgi:hypothetical protein